MSRATVLRLLGGGTLLGAKLVGTSGSAFAAGEAPLIERAVPKSGEALPAVGLGTWQTFDIAAEAAALAQRREVLEVLLEGGGRVIDSSPMYGRAEQVVGRLLAELGAGERAFLATKVWTRGRRAGIRQMESSLAKLKRSRIELMQVHNLLDLETHLATLRAWKDEGRIAHLGITHYTTAALPRLAALIRREDLDFVQLAYSIAVRAAEREVLPLAAERGVAVLVNRPFEGGGLFRKVRGRDLPPWAAELGIASWGQYFLKFVLSQPAVTCVIPGTSKARHMADNLGAGRGPLPDAEARERMAAYWRNL